MFSKPKTLVLALVTVFLGSSSASLAATYSFLTVTPTGPLTSKFTSLNGNGFINVSHVFSAGGAGGSDNIVEPSQFNTLFPTSGTVQGHIAQTIYNHTSDVTFDLTTYALSNSTVFGIWNTTDELTQPVTYRVTVIDSANNPQPPSTFSLLGNDDNALDVSGKHRLVMNAAGDILTGPLINSSGTHMDAAFWDKLIIPTGTKQIIVHGNLTSLNTIGDGVGYYFAELAVPEPSTLAISALGLFSLGMFGRRRKQ